MIFPGLISIFFSSLGIVQWIRSADTKDLTISDDIVTNLGPNQSLLHFNLSTNISFDRKQFQNIWIYKNGFVTLGLPLEEENYPILSPSDGIDQPFENMIGSNVIAVFITANEIREDSRVSARQVSPQSLDESDRQLLLKIKEQINRWYGVSSLEYLITIDWNNMKSIGVQNGTENFFRLWLLSNGIKTFGLIQHRKIRSLGYKKSDKWMPYQCGISSYSYMKSILKFYNATDENLPLDRSSNIGERNTWLFLLGDTSYSMDIGILVNVQQMNSTSSLSRVTRISSRNDGKRNSKILKNRLFVGDKSTSEPISSQRSISRKISTRLRLLKQLVLEESKPTPIDQSTTRKVSISSTKARQMSKDILSQHWKMSSYNNMPSQSSNLDVQGKTRSALTTIGSITKVQRLIELRGQKQRTAKCSESRCSTNERCIGLNNDVCCICEPGAVYLDKRCVRNGENFFINSRGMVQLSSMGKQFNLKLSLVIAKRSSSNDDFQRAHLLLLSEDQINQELRHFLLVLYPLFHVPMSFYASSWTNETVPNLSSLVDQVAGINIYLAVDRYEDILMTFKVNRTNGEDEWTVNIAGLDMKKLEDLNLKNRKWDEKSSAIHNLTYNLLHGSSIEYPEQTVVYQDEDSNNFLNIKWRGTMTFSATCLSNHIGNKRYYVKFSDKRYCNSDCLRSLDLKRVSCRMMCLSSPHVFDTDPGPCGGNFCGPNMVCIDKGSLYECVCKSGYRDIGDSCVSDSFSSTLTPVITPSFKQNKKKCESCSDNADCLMVKDEQCCVCKSGYFGSGRTCMRRDGNLDVRLVGLLEFPDGFETPWKHRLNFYFRQGKGGAQYATVVEIENFPYDNAYHRRIFDTILLLTPMFDVLLSIFAGNQSSLTSIENIYSISGRSTSLRLIIGGSHIQDIEIRINLSNQLYNPSVTVSIMGISRQNLGDNLLKESKKHFNSRSIADMRYTVEGTKILFPKSKISLPKNSEENEMWWEGAGELSFCASNLTKQTYLVQTGNQYHCNAICPTRSCQAYCQTSPSLSKIPDYHSTLSPECLKPCHSAALCVGSKCICRPGYSGNGLQCQQIRKVLECRKSSDCSSRLFTKCLHNRCVCIAKPEVSDMDCPSVGICPTCGSNEHCIAGQCVCKPQFVRNRLSQRCVFDCSLCDEYSTMCTDVGCTCNVRYVPSNDSSLRCLRTCSSDVDCPTDEICNPSKICVCPYMKEDGVCRQKPVCSNCHENALCHGNQCKCKENWVGDGITCNYNCSLCWNNSLCDPAAGCICLIGQKVSNKCTYKHCYGQCTGGSRCVQAGNSFKCICPTGLIFTGKECVDDLTELNILPYGPSINASEGEGLDLICLASSRRSSVNLQWSRRSGQSLQGYQEFADSSNMTLRLHLDSMTTSDSDFYICKTKTGEEVQINVSVRRADIPCEGRCHKLGYCDNGVCRCATGYVGNGIICELESGCAQNCSPEQVCDRESSKCVCKPGMVLNTKSKLCSKDCRKYPICDKVAHCNTSSGLCECGSNYFGNGTHCFRGDNCLLTKNCVANASCTEIAQFNYHLCFCNEGFVGDGTSNCHLRIDCATHYCGQYSFCEPVIVRDIFGAFHRNGKCSCEPGFVMIAGVCEEKRQTTATVWTSIGESIISQKIGESGKSRIRYIDIPRHQEVSGSITAITGSCKQNRLVWSGQNGVNIKSAQISNFSSIVNHLQERGRVSGMSMDEWSGNFYFTDSLRGQIGVTNIYKNYTRIIVDIKDYHPGSIVVHSRSGKMFWIVNDYQNPRIELADLTGANRHIFASLNNRAVSLVVAPDFRKQDRLCWMEMMDPLTRSKTLAKAIIKCANIDSLHSPVVKNHYRILSEEPYLGLAFFNKRFYWSVREGRFLKSWSTSELKLDIHPNCCDASIRSLTIVPDHCSTDADRNNPCVSNPCPEICVPLINARGSYEPFCLSSNV